MNPRIEFNTLGHDFHIDGRLVFHLRAHARVQLAILTALQLACWSTFVPAVLNGPAEEIVTKRLKHAIKALNRRQSWIRFHQDGDGVRWNWRMFAVDGYPT